MKPTLQDLEKFRDNLPFKMHSWQWDDILAAKDCERFALFIPVGGGKTVMATMIAHAWGDDTIIVVLPPILITQWVTWLNTFPELGGAIAFRGTPKERYKLPIENYRWVVMSMDIFKIDWDNLCDHYSMSQVSLVVDECFPADTKVLTEAGSVNIGSLRIGDKVLTSSGPQAIVKVFEALAHELVTLKVSDGRSITCTPNHPIFTDRGWLSARDCQGRAIVSSHALSDVRRGVQQAQELACLGKEESSKSWPDLFQTLRLETKGLARPYLSSEDYGGSEQGGQVLDTSAPKTFVAGASGGSIRIQQREAFSRCKEGKWDRVDGGRVGYSSCHGASELPLELIDTDENCSGVRLPLELQSGFRKPGEKSSFRGGREQSPNFAGEVERREKDQAVRVVRVESVSSFKPATPVPVYNLHVENCPHYFAEGVLVHNCHNLKNTSSKNFKKVQLFAAGRKLLLATGTELNDPIDAYAYIKLKTANIYRTKTHFENMHVEARDFYEKPTVWKNVEQIAEHLYKFSAKRSKEEIHSHLPKATYTPIVYDLAPKHLRLYNKLAADMLLELPDGGKIDATTGSGLYNALQQVIVNWDKFAGEVGHRPAVFDLIDEVCDEIELGKPKSSKLIVWTWFKATTEAVLNYLNSKFPKSCVAAYSGANSEDSVQRFLNDPTCLVLVAQPGSAGAGLNPQHVCWEALFIEAPTRTIAFKQAAGRIDREGQRYNPTIRVAMALDTIQMSMFRSLLRNDSQVMKIQDETDLRAAIYGT